MNIDTKLPNSVGLNRHEWRLSETLYTAFHAWYLILVFGLIGALLGWGASRLWPASYRTRAEIAVTLNPYRTYSDSQFLALVYPQYTNIDDYKNWQMSQLSAALFTDSVLEPTLKELRQEDDYWVDVDLIGLRDMLRSEWRTAGVWTLLADSKNAKRSNQAVRAWSRNAVSGVKQAIFASGQLFQVDEALKNIVAQQTKNDLLQEEYQITRQQLQDWLTTASTLPADQPLSVTERWQILYRAGRVAQFSPAWMELLGMQPAETALPKSYIALVNQIIAAIDAEAPALKDRASFLEQQQSQLADKYNTLQETSLGLSPNITIKSLNKSSPEVIRPTILMVLAGAVSGLLAWFIWLFASITRLRLKQ